ncbi:cyclic nucleotide-binding domain-containing protein [Deltaproteobacteria bacterium TL4]
MENTLSSYNLKYPKIEEKQKTPLVRELMDVIHIQNKIIHKLENEIKNPPSPSEQELDFRRFNIYNVLKTKRTFQLMPDPMLRSLVINMKVLRVKKGENVLVQNEPSPYVYLLLRGKVAVLVDGTLIYNFARIGDIFGEISYLNKTPCTATIRAEENLELLALTHKILAKIGGTDFYLWLCRILSDKLSRTSKQISQNDQNKPKPALAPEKKVTPLVDETCYDTEDTLALELEDMTGNSFPLDLEEASLVATGTKKASATQNEAFPEPEAPAKEPSAKKIEIPKNEPEYVMGAEAIEVEEGEMAGIDSEKMKELLKNINNLKL